MVNKLAKKNKKKNGGGKSIMRTIFKWLRVGSFFVGGASYGLRAYSEPRNQLLGGIAAYAGIENVNDPKFNWSVLAEAWTPFLAVTAMTYAVQKLGGILRRM